MQASTPSTCLRSDSDSVHSQKRRQASSRSTALTASTLTPAAPVGAAKLLNLAGVRRGPSVELPVHCQRSAAARKENRPAVLLEVLGLDVLGEVGQRPVNRRVLRHVRMPL